MRRGHAPLDPGAGLLLGLDLRRVRGQVSERVVPGVRGEELQHRTRAMGVQAVPDDQERPAELAAEVGQRPEHGPRIGRSRLVPGVEPPLRCDDDNARDLTASAHAPYHGRLTGVRPRLAHVAFFIRIRKVWPVSSHSAIIRPSRRAFFLGSSAERVGRIGGF